MAQSVVQIITTPTPTAGDIVVDTETITIRSSGAGALGAITTKSEDGDTTIELGASVTVTAGDAGVFAVTTGLGSINITTGANGAVTSSTGDPDAPSVIGAITTVAKGDGVTTISLGAAVHGDGAGIDATSEKSGKITLTSTTGGTITSGDGYGVIARSNEGDIDLGGADGIAGAISGRRGGIYAWSNLGSITVKTVTGGTVSGGAGFNGITADAKGAGKTINLSLGANVTAGAVGVYATGAGAITLTADAGVTIHGGTTAISAISTAGDVAIGGATGLSGEITGGVNGVYAETGNGAIRIKTIAGGAITGTTGVGITTKAASGPTIISLGADVIGATRAIAANATGAGDITITSTAGVAISSNSTMDYDYLTPKGFTVVVESKGGNVSMGGPSGLSGSVTGGQGIWASTTGVGTISVQTAADHVVNADFRLGIETLADQGVTTINLAGQLSGASRGVWAHSGSGPINVITASGSTITSYGDGVIADSVSGDINIGGPNGLKGKIEVGGAGILATTGGSGKIDIKTGAGGTVTTDGDAAIVASAGGDATITLGAPVLGYEGGIKASAGGKVTITAAPGVSVVGKYDYGITATSLNGNVDIGGATGLGGVVRGVGGILAQADNGSVTIKTLAGGTVVGASSFGDGVNTTAGGSTSITLGDHVSSQAKGVVALGGGPITLTTASGVSISGATTGISATSSSGDVTIGDASGLSGAVTGGVDGIFASAIAGAVTVKTITGGVVTGNSGFGVATVAGSSATTSITLGADVSGLAGEGVRTVAASGRTSIVIGGAATVSGSTAAIKSTTQGGSVIVDNAGVVRGALSASGTGTFAFNNSGALVMLGAQTNTGFTINNLSGGVLTGTGAFGAVSAQAGSIIRPGDRTTPTMGVMTASSITLATGAIFEVRANASGPDDKLVVTGSAAIDTGATLRMLASPQTSAVWTGAKTFTVLSAGALTGNFSNVETDYAFLTITSVKTGNDVTATLTRNRVPFSSYATTPNQKAVANALDTFQAQTASPLIAAATTLTATQAPRALTQLAGAGIAVARRQAFTASGLVTSAIDLELGKVTGAIGGGAVRAYAPEKPLGH